LISFLEVGRKRPKKIPQIVIISGILIKSPHDDDDDDVFLLHLNFQDYQKPPNRGWQEGCFEESRWISISIEASIFGD
jgi:hypothetical protein